ncbi:helix-turn-helix transcriptional regulator [Rhodovulum sp. FJ3]|jgi:transcriptional regulator with XRE-family HTH domain|uniref:helix-turn-helix domain-containing protein n=1 Tax=Rhodovulum sp. FJ3 TaxID=3079053 RepID=UPI00293DFCDB|nr:helix-turn-helix transcriptional regulator [Rhodovulum sp. FJ3]MDV4166986.1 helix-turn-helix transcriptional regulator [Rhodovulum sp. FJ3]MEC8629941.1 helix-turn-helix transcriptional regulator [Pseudomonadota bacterium]
MDQEMEQENWYSEDAATFGDRLVGAREAMGMSQADLARRLGVKLKTVGAWEQDLSEPRANKLQMLAGVLNVSIMWLLNGEGDGIDGPDNEAALPADVANLLSDIRQVKLEVNALGGRLGRLEKRLRLALKDHV